MAVEETDTVYNIDVSLWCCVANSYCYRSSLRTMIDFGMYRCLQISFGLTSSVITWQLEKTCQKALNLNSKAFSTTSHRQLQDIQGAGHVYNYVFIIYTGTNYKYDKYVWRLEIYYGRYWPWLNCPHQIIHLHLQIEPFCRFSAWHSQDMQDIGWSQDQATIAGNWVSETEKA